MDYDICLKCDHRRAFNKKGVCNARMYQSHNGDWVLQMAGLIYHPAVCNSASLFEYREALERLNTYKKKYRCRVLIELKNDSKSINEFKRRGWIYRRYGTPNDDEYVVRRKHLRELMDSVEIMDKGHDSSCGCPYFVEHFLYDGSNKKKERLCQD